MPIIPRAAPQVREIGSLARVRNTTQVEAPRGLANAVAGVVGGAQDIYQAHQDRADAASLMEADRKLSDWYNNWHDPNNEKGVRAYQGRNAMALRDTMLPDFDKAQAEIAQNLPSERARMKFQASAAVQREQADRWVNGYANSQLEAYEAAENKAWTETTVNDLTTAELAGDPDRAATVWGIAMDRVTADGAARGRPIEETKLRVQAMKGAVRAGVIDRKMIDDPTGAQAYYNQHFADMDQDTRTRIEAKLHPVLMDKIGDKDAAWALAGGEQPDHDTTPRGQPTPQIASVINAAADKYGVPREYMYALAEQESGFRAKAVNPEKINGNDNATGLYQWSEESAAEWGVKDRTDPVQSAEATARRFKKNMDAHGADFAIAAHFGGEGGAAAVVQRGRTQENPRTTAYLGQVRARASSWRGHAGQPTQRTVAAGPAPSQADALERIQTLPVERRRVAEAKVKDAFQIRKLREDENERAATEQINMAIWEGDPNRSLPQVLGPDQYAYAVRKGLVPSLTQDLIFRRSEKTRVDVKGVVSPYLELMRKNPEEFARMDVAKNARHMTPETMKALTDAQADIRSGKGGHDYATENEQLDALVYGPMKLTGDTAAAKAKRAPFETAWYQMKREFAKTHPDRAPNADEREAMIKRLAKSFALNQVEGYGEADVPETDREQILAAYAKAGKPEPDEKTIRRHYLTRAKL